MTDEHDGDDDRSGTPDDPLSDVVDDIRGQSEGSNRDADETDHGGPPGDGSSDAPHSPADTGPQFGSGPGEPPDDLGVGGDDTAGEAERSPRSDAPLGDLAEEVGRRRDAPDDDFDSHFREEEVGDIDTEELWDQIEHGSARDHAAENTDERTKTADERTVREIPKRTYCQTCQYFQAPPDVGCTHPGTEILELVDVDHFRVVDCPVVAEDERLGELGAGIVDEREREENELVGGLDVGSGTDL